jgi:uncharacterized protein
VKNLAKIATKIPQLDRLLKGGLESGSVSCLWIKPGIDGTPFGYHIAHHAAKTGNVFYVVNTKNPDTTTKEMKSYGLSPAKVNFVDAYSASVGAKPTSKLAITDPKDIDEVVESISIIVKKIKNPLIIIDSLSTLIDLTEKENTDFLDKIKQLKATVVCLFTEWPYSAALKKNLQNAFDTIIDITFLEKKVFFREYFSVSKMKGLVDKEVIPYRVIKPGGIKIYIPKILVTGPFNAGKTSFIHTASSRAVSVDRLGTTIALDHGHVKYKDFAVDLFGTPGQQRFDPILKLLGGEALGVIVVISATDPQGFKRAIEMTKKAAVYGLPVVFAANKSNLRGAIDPKQIKYRLGLKDEVVVPITAKDLTKVQPGIPCQLKQRDIEKVLDAIFNKLLEGGL